MTDLDRLQWLSKQGALMIDGPHFVTQTELKFFEERVKEKVAFKYLIRNTHFRYISDENKTPHPLLTNKYYSVWFFDIKDNLVGVIHSGEEDAEVSSD